MRRLAASLVLLALVACDRFEDTPAIGVTRATPAQTLVCMRAALRAQPVRTAPRPAPAGGWRLRVDAPVWPPAGWVHKGDIVHEDGVLAWLPHGASRGIADRRADRAVQDALAACR